MFPIGFSETSGKTSHTVFHSRLILVMPVCRSAWNEEMVTMIEALTDQGVGRSVGRSKGVNGLWISSPSGVSSKILIPLLCCEGVLPLQLK